MSKSTESAILEAFAGTKKAPEQKPVEQKPVEQKPVNESAEPETIEEAGKPTMAQRKKTRLGARRRGRGVYKSRALARAMKKAMRKTPKAKLRLRAKKALKTRRRRYGESAIDSVQSVIETVLENKAMTDEEFTSIKENLMVHLNECVAEGLNNEEMYSIILNDIAPVMQVVESVMSREGNLDERDTEYLGAYNDYLDEVAEDLDNDDESKDD